MRLWVAKGFILPSLSFFVYLSFTHPLFACGVMRRHRGHTEARWEGHYDLCVLLLSRLLWRTEGELLLLHDHINAKLQNTNSRVSISQIKDQRCKAVISRALSNHQRASIEISTNKILPVAGAVFICFWKIFTSQFPDGNSALNNTECLLIILWIFTVSSPKRSTLWFGAYIPKFSSVLWSSPLAVASFYWCGFWETRPVWVDFLSETLVDVSSVSSTANNTSFFISNVYHLLSFYSFMKCIKIDLKGN